MVEERLSVLCQNHNWRHSQRREIPLGSGQVVEVCRKMPEICLKHRWRNIESSMVSKEWLLVAGKERHPDFRNERRMKVVFRHVQFLRDRRYHLHLLFPGIRDLQTSLQGI